MKTVPGARLQLLKMICKNVHAQMTNHCGTARQNNVLQNRWHVHHNANRPRAVTWWYYKTVNASVSMDLEWGQMVHVYATAKLKTEFVLLFRSRIQV